MKRVVLQLVAGICMLLADQAFGDIPKQMNYQGILSGSTGNPLADSTVDVSFSIYNAPAGGFPVWAETLSVTTDDEGRFNVTLGQVHPIEDTVFNNTERYLSINVESSGEMIPRSKLTSVGYANRISTVDGAKGGYVHGGTVIAGSGPNDVLVLDAGDPNVALELRSGTFGGQPFIDFVNDAVSDNDARIQLKSDNGLEISVDSMLNVPTGLVGLGTVTPEARLHVRGGSPARGIIIENTASANSDDIRIKRPGPESAGSPRFSFSQRFNNTDFWLYGYDGTTFKNFMGFNYAANAVASPADGNNLYVDNANSRVGIGTASPSQKLHVGGNARVDDTLFASNVSSLSPLRLQTAGTTRMYIDDASGNVGIGTTAPEAKLDVSGGKLIVQSEAGSATFINRGEFYNDNSLVAWGNVSGAGAVEGEFGVTSVIRTAAGSYTVTINAVAGSFNTLIPIAQAVSTSGSPRILNVFPTSGNTFNVFIYSTGAVLTDTEFVFMVTAR